MERVKQCVRILSLLQSQEWTSLPAILDLRIAKYSSRITELRHMGYIIQCDEKRVGRQRHTRYRLLGHLHDQAKTQLTPVEQYMEEGRKLFGEEHPRNQVQLSTDDGFIEATNEKATQA